MALFMKQDFSPPILSKKWIMIKFRQNMQLHSREHIISILESGLLFREDSVEVEQECPSSEEVWRVAGGGRGGWLTGGERGAAIAVVAASVAVFPPKGFNRSTFVYLAAYISVPLLIRAYHRASCRGTSLKSLLTHMRQYLALARRAAACLKECATLHTQLGSVSSAVDSMHTLLCRQQSELATLMSRASSALLGNAPWLHADVPWRAVVRSQEDEQLMKIHHAFLVVQSTLLKHISMAHYIPSPHYQKIYKNHNERIYWIHTVLIEHLNKEFKENYESLDRMYRLLKNYGNKDVEMSKKPGSAVLDRWLYSDVHTGIARTCLELKITLNKCSNLDMFMDNCALQEQELNLDILNKDIDDLIEDLTKCLSTVQSSQIRLKKLQSKFSVNDVKYDVENVATEVKSAGILTIEDREPETRDEVFYFIKTDDDDVLIRPAGDVTTAPGKKERETTEVVLRELKRKLVKREDFMRERERQALVKTMPELKDNLPEFPRQIEMEEFVDRKGYITKITRKSLKKRLFRNYRIHKRSNLKYTKKYKIKINKYKSEMEIQQPVYEANANLKYKSKFLTLTSENNYIVICKWCKCEDIKKQEEFSDLSEGLSDVEVGAANKAINQSVNSNHKQNGAVNLKFSKQDLELSPSSSESDFEDYKAKQVAILNDIRRHRAARKKNYPVKRAAVDKDSADESLKPIEYSFGAGMAMASVLQINNKAKLPNMAREEVFVGDGEVSEDSGNDEDA